MVNWWTYQRERSIKLFKYRIKHHEKHGDGSVAMQEKEILKKQERHHQIMKEKNAST